ncbi:aromatic ring-hydroxylating oxygenase subunit alpha [Immundisolibacter cernigliae]|uniref:Benzoate 1,2-dioxygenase large subunit n=1 Tax=Immundisolibacter cernigliae TaxID=1810504 RepID=A0A1B1YUY1_9GAMM|nr:aromatic ring-hydroxylating dioxygenase subunit alpha [Immundisolibacter cernigliae]ANX04680.1 benzoate 1,2-dioxygenase large subunit [Immundisolibacter cernigliae]
MKIETINTWIDDRISEGVFDVNRDVYLNPELFELEMKHIFEASWLYLCHESQIPNAGDFFATHMGRQPVIIVRGKDDQVRGFVNACAHRGATLCRTRKGNQQFFTCPYHGWVYDTAGKNVDIKDHASGAYPAAFEAQSHDLTAIPKLESYRGFVFGSLSADVPTLAEHLGAAMPFIDLMADQSPEGLEVLRGSSTYTYNSNWKLQAENGVDGYHVTSVHANYVAMVQRRMTMGKEDKVKAIVGGGDITKMTSGAYDLGMGHSLLWGEVPGANDRPLAQRRAEIEQRMGPVQAHWMIDCSRNLGLFPNVFLMDQTSTQIRVFRPLAIDKTEVTIFCIAPKGESASARTRRVRQYEDFFNATGMATPDDLSEFEACQAGNQGLAGTVQHLDRGLSRVIQGADEAARSVGSTPHTAGPNWADENIFHSFYRRWHQLLTGSR